MNLYRAMSHNEFFDLKIKRKFSPSSDNHLNIESSTTFQYTEKLKKLGGKFFFIDIKDAKYFAGFCKTDFIKSISLPKELLKPENCGIGAYNNSPKIELLFDIQTLNLSLYKENKLFNNSYNYEELLFSNLKYQGVDLKKEMVTKNIYSLLSKKVFPKEIIQNAVYNTIQELGIYE